MTQAGTAGNGRRYEGQACGGALLGNVSARPLIRQPLCGCHLPPPGEGNAGGKPPCCYLLKTLSLLLFLRQRLATLFFRESKEKQKPAVAASQSLRSWGGLAGMLFAKLGKAQFGQHRLPPVGDRLRRGTR